LIIALEEKARNKLIQRELKDHAKNLRREYKILLLRDHDCVQTLITSMKIAYSAGFTNEEHEKYQ
jgi:hypothetical protein